MIGTAQLKSPLQPLLWNRVFWERGSFGSADMSPFMGTFKMSEQVCL